MLVALHTKVSSQPETRFPRCTKPIYPHPFSRGLGLTQPLNSEKGLLMANAPVDHSFFEAKAFPQSSLNNCGDLEATLFSHPNLYSLSWSYKVIRFFCKSNIHINGTNLA